VGFCDCGQGLNVFLTFIWWGKMVKGGDTGGVPLFLRGGSIRAMCLFVG